MLGGGRVGGVRGLFEGVVWGLVDPDLNNERLEITQPCQYDRQTCMYIYIHAEDLIWWAIFWLQNIKKQRERRKTKAEEGRQKKEEETCRHEK